jgi:signal transduction histidine kinase
MVCGAGLLAVTYALVSSQITGGVGIEIPRAPALTHAQAVAPARGIDGGRRAAPSGNGGATGLPPPDLKMPTVPAAVVRVMGSSAGQAFLRLVETQQRVDELHQLEIESGIALGIMTILSGAVGWVLAGRVLRPLRTITAATQQISATSLGRRLHLPGPRDELRTLADTIDGLLARLEAAFESQRQFVANASHELRTPLATMRAALDVVSAKPHVSPSQVRALDASLREDLDGADRLLESFLVLARSQRAGLGDETTVSLAQVVVDVLAKHGQAIAARQIELERTLTPTSVFGSETLLRRMVDNLIDNAVRHNLPKGSITVTCAADREAARLVVESGGQVFDEEAVVRLAEPFTRLGAERTGSQNGHGLGLSIVAAVATAHGGKLRLYAREMGGLGADVTLPLAHDSQVATRSA